jgi:hypothetical protein
MTNAESILRKAAKELRERGWCKGTAVNGRGNVCMIGALRAAVWGTPMLSLHGGEFFKPLHEVTGCSSISTFNDNHCETIDDAIAAFEIAADLAS